MASVNRTQPFYFQEEEEEKNAHLHSTINIFRYEKILFCVWQ